MASLVSHLLKISAISLIAATPLSGMGSTSFVSARTDVISLVRVAATGALPQEVIDAEVRKRQNQIDACYDQTLPRLGGRVELAFVIGGSGSILEAWAITDDLGTKHEVANCMIERIGWWQFPESVDGSQTTATCLWSFQPGTTRDYKAEINATVRGHAEQIKACYERERRNDPNLEGKVEITFVIDRDGAVSDARAVSDELGTERKVSSCMVPEIERLMFPAPPSGNRVVVTYPWNFRAEERD